MTAKDEFEKAIVPYKILCRDNQSLRIRSRYEWGTFSAVAILASVAIAELQSASTFVRVEAAIVVIVFFLLHRWSSTARQPMEIRLQKGLLILRFRKFFGGVKELSISSRTIAGIQPEVIQSRYGTYAVVCLHFADQHCERWYFAKRQFDRSQVSDYASLIANTFSTMLGVPLLDPKKPTK